MVTGVPGIAAERLAAFRERARLEADRYGPDPWIFVRELLQNSRDAGATAVDLTVGQDDNHEWVCCFDDGEGMTFEHARRYLFALYASSKEDSKNQAGKFGVGFWSVLRFEPTAITIRSQTRSGQAWGLRLDGTLEHGEHVAPLERFGTEIVLTRVRGDGRLQHRVFDAVRQSARYVRQRDSEKPLPIRVDGRQANEEFALLAPSSSFKRRGVRGVVGLGSAPRVELFSRGLRVRSAACLEDLVAPTGRHTSRMRVQFPELPGGLAPQALLESDALEVMLSRSDARDNRALSRLVKLAQRELERLVEQQLAHARPQPWFRRAWDRASATLRNSLAARTILGAGLGAAMAVGLSLWLWGPSTPESAEEVPTLSAESDAPLADRGVAPGMRPYQDLGQRYRGPRVDVLSPGSSEPTRLDYQPPDVRLHFAGLTMPTLAADGSPLHDRIPVDAGAYPGAQCTSGCVDVSVDMAGRASPQRLLVPSGHRIVDASVTFDGTPVEVRTSAEGHAIVTLPPGTVGPVEFQTVAAREPDDWSHLRPPPLPRSLQRIATRARTKPLRERVEALVEAVRDEVAYDRSPELARRHGEAMRSGAGFIERTLEIGAGDCDIQNGVLVAVLQSAGVPSRLAVGLLGVDGGPLPFLHAWVEYLGDDGHWHVVDASETAGQGIAAVAGRPTVGGPADSAGVGSALPPSAEGGLDPLGNPAGVGSDALASADGGLMTPDDGGFTPDDAAQGGGIASTNSSLGAEQPKTSRPHDRDTIAAMLRDVDERHPWLLPLLPVLLLLFSALALLRGRTLRDVKLEDSTDLSRLLQGVLQQPAAFSHMASLFHRPLVPRIRGRALSLQRCRELAAKGRLYRTETCPDLARRAARHGAAVLDCRTPEGRIVADALGAADLDAWDRLLQEARADELTNAVNQALERGREPWRVRLGSSVPGRFAVLDLAPLGVRLPGATAARIVIVDMISPFWIEAAAAHGQSPRTAVFQVLDQLTERLDLPDERRAPLLSERAQAALIESFGRPY